MGVGSRSGRGQRRGTGPWGTGREEFQVPRRRVVDDNFGQTRSTLGPGSLVSLTSGGTEVSTVPSVPKPDEKVKNFFQ